MNEMQWVGFQCVSLLWRLPYVLSVMQVIILYSIHHFSADSSFFAVNLLSSYINMNDVDNKLKNVWTNIPDSKRG